MSKLINYNSVEGKVLKEFFQEHRIDPYIAMIVESYIYKGKFIKDGKVAVIYCDSYGIGWWTQNYIDELAFDPKLVEIILHPNFESNSSLQHRKEDKSFDKELDNKINDYLKEVKERKYKTRWWWKQQHYYENYKEDNEDEDNKVRCGCEFGCECGVECEGGCECEDEYKYWTPIDIIYRLNIEWVSLGKKFLITEYDGLETVHVEGEAYFLKA